MTAARRQQRELWHIRMPKQALEIHLFFQKTFRKSREILRP
jgi:hypothetical protein